MSVPASLIPELEEVLARGSAERRTRTLQRITSLFLNGADQFSGEHVSLFDNVFIRLIDEIETKARAELSHRLAPVSNAPIEAVRVLAKDDDISVAGPMLQHSTRLPDADLIEIAKTKGQPHLLAISGRTGIAEAVTDELVRRGDRQVVRGVAGNRRARISERSFSALVNRAERDGELAEKVGTRPDIPPRLFRELLLQATEVVQKRLLAAAPPDTQAEIRRVLSKVSHETVVARRRDYAVAARTIDALRQQGSLNEGALVEFANARQYEETVVALARLCSVPVDVVDRLMGGDRADPILILCRAAGWEWPTAKVLIQARPDGKGTPSHMLDSAFANFERLSPATAQRVTRFWRARPAFNAEPA
jgi:uncharacterized protein (DUF2336 family)